MLNLNDLPEKLRDSGTNRIEYYLNGKKQTRLFKEVYEDVIKVGRLLRAKNIGKGSRIGILGKNSYEWIVIDLACLVTGVITIPFEVGKAHVARELISEFGLSCLFTNLPEYADPSNDRILSFNQVTSLAEELMNNHFCPAPDLYGPNDIFTVVSTSGTVGKSKFIEIRKKSFDHLLIETQQLLGFTGEDRFLVFLPLNIYLERCYVYSAILLGFSVILTPLELVFHSITHDKPSVIIGIPYFFETFHAKFLQKIHSNIFFTAVLKSYLFLHAAGLGFIFGNRFAPFVKAWGGHLRYLLTGSAPIRKETLLFYKKMGITLYEGYGLTEIGGMITLNSPGRVKLGSVGKPFPGKEVTIDDSGQIIVRSEYLANITYYKSTKEENDRTYLPDGSVATGDLGYFDKEGFLYINGRIKDLIVTSAGKKVHPTSIEERIIDSGLFNNCMVYGDDKPFLVALVVPKNASVGYERIKSEFTRINSGLAVEERVMKFHVHPESFSIDNGFLTSSLKSNRPRIAKTFEKEFNQLYNS